jgi:hypothetical protein
MVPIGPIVVRPTTSIETDHKPSRVIDLTDLVSDSPDRQAVVIASAQEAKVRIAANAVNARF